MFGGGGTLKCVQKTNQNCSRFAGTKTANLAAIPEKR